jgi:hypothetical protein
MTKSPKPKGDDRVAYLTWLLNSYYRAQRRELGFLSDLDPAVFGDWAATEYQSLNNRIQKIRLELQLAKEAA